jgi:hypothetical protein
MFSNVLMLAESWPLMPRCFVRRAPNPLILGHLPNTLDMLK